MDILRVEKGGGLGWPAYIRNRSNGRGLENYVTVQRGAGRQKKWVISSKGTIKKEDKRGEPVGDEVKKLALCDAGNADLSCWVHSKRQKN